MNKYVMSKFATKEHMYEAMVDEIARLQALVDEMSEYDRRIKAEGVRELRDAWLKNMHNEMSFSAFCDKYADKLEEKGDE